jgi:arabinose-5-phosphate isomerase
MHTGDEIPAVAPGVRLRDGLMEMSAKGLGMTAIVDDDYRPVAVFTDGDLRRALDAGADVHKTPMREIVQMGCRTIGHGALAIEAVNLLEEFRITALPVVDGDGKLVGALNIHDLFRAGIM